jgi:hypothetical protein
MFLATRAVNEWKYFPRKSSVLSGVYLTCGGDEPPPSLFGILLLSRGGVEVFQTPIYNNGDVVFFITYLPFHFPPLIRGPSSCFSFSLFLTVPTGIFATHIELERPLFLASLCQPLTT